MSKTELLEKVLSNRLAGVCSRLFDFMYRWVPGFLLASVVLFALYMNQSVIPHFFDETNQFNIIGSSFSGIFRVLAEEQNFPLGYVFDRIVYLLVLESVAAYRITYFIFWGLTLLLFYKLCRQHFESPENALWATLFLSLAFTITQYAFSFRIYVYLHFLVALIFFLLQRFYHSGEKRAFYLAVAAAVLLVSLHPAGIIFTAIFLMSLLLLHRERWQVKSVLLGGVLAVASLSINLALKTDLMRIYVDVGPEYIPAGIHFNPTYFLMRIISKGRKFQDSSWIWFAWFINVWVVVVLFCQARDRNRTPLILFSCVVFLLLLALTQVLPDTLQSRHLTVFTPVVILFLSTIVRSRFLTFVCATAMIWSFYMMALHKYRIDLSKKNSCLVIAEYAKDSIAISSFFFLEWYARCAPDMENYLYTGSELLPVSELDDPLVLQAMLGGRIFKKPDLQDLVEGIDFSSAAYVFFNINGIQCDDENTTTLRSLLPKSFGNRRCRTGLLAFQNLEKVPQQEQGKNYIWKSREKF